MTDNYQKSEFQSLFQSEFDFKWRINETKQHYEDYRKTVNKIIEDVLLVTLQQGNTEKKAFLSILKKTYPGMIKKCVLSKNYCAW